jgi:hypothetical protein
MKLVPVDTAATAAALATRAEPELSLVPATPAGDRARQLMLEARAAALEHLEALRQSSEETRTLAKAVGYGGDLYTVGLQDFARRMAEDLEWRAKTLEALIERQREASGVRRATFLRAQP